MWLASWFAVRHKNALLRGVNGDGAPSRGVGRQVRFDEVNVGVGRRLDDLIAELNHSERLVVERRQLIGAAVGGTLFGGVVCRIECVAVSVGANGYFGNGIRIGFGFDLYGKGKRLFWRRLMHRNDRVRSDRRQIAAQPFFDNKLLQFLVTLDG